MFKIINNSDGGVLLIVLIFGGVVMALAFALASRTVQTQSDILKSHNKTQVYYDRELIKFDLANRPLPSPVP